MDYLHTSAPQSHGQPSRKSKRAWRKNIDLSSVDRGLESAREEIIQTGGQILADIPSSSLFQTDIEGSEAIRKEHLHRYTRPLRADQILASRSAIPAVNTRKRSLVPSDSTNQQKKDKVTRLSAKEVGHLRQVAYGGDSTHKDVVVVPPFANHDPWASPDNTTTKQTEPFSKDTTDYRIPKTIKNTPMSQISNNEVNQNVLKPHSGRSYNPSFQDWDDLVKAAGEGELKAERSRLAKMVTEQEMLDRIAASSKEADRAEAEKESNLLAEYESEWDGIQSEAEEVNIKRREPKRKTPAERNKVKRRRKAESLARHESRMKQRDNQVEHLEQVQQELEAKHARMRLAMQKANDFMGESKAHMDGAALNPRRRQLGRRMLSEAPLELVLAEELQDSLRLLKPEGNLLRDRFRNLLLQGKLENRKPITQPKKAKRKATEKWSYKDFQVPV